MPQCPECDSQVEIPEDSCIDDLLECENCGVELVIINLDPPEVEIFEEEEK